MQASSLASTGWGSNLSSRCAALSSPTSPPPTFPRLFPTTSLPYQEVHHRHSSTLLLFLQTHPPHPQSGESSQSPPTTSVSETFSTMFPYLGPAPLFPEHYLYPHLRYRLFAYNVFLQWRFKGSSLINPVCPKKKQAAGKTARWRWRGRRGGCGTGPRLRPAGPHARALR